MLVLEIENNTNKENLKRKHTRRESNLYFMQVETDINNLKYELKQMQSIYKNLDININTFLNDNDIIQAFIIGYYHFKSSYKVFKDVDIITDNKKVFVITKEHLKVIKQVINYYELIIKVMKKKANKKQLANINKYLDHYK